MARHSDPDNLTWAPLLYRAPWAILTGRAARGPVTVAGDAFHPMTPDMAQGGCAALEDAIVLARALSSRSPSPSPADGVAAYVAERRGSAAWIVAGAYLSGYVQQGSTSAPACAPPPSSCSATGSSTASSSPCSPTPCGSTAATSSRRRRATAAARRKQLTARRAMYTEKETNVLSVVQSLQVGPDHLYHRDTISRVIDRSMTCV